VFGGTLQLCGIDLGFYNVIIHPTNQTHFTAGLGINQLCSLATKVCVTPTKILPIPCFLSSVGNLARTEVLNQKDRYH
jgi:hypothetical protein